MISPLRRHVAAPPAPARRGPVHPSAIARHPPAAGLAVLRLHMARLAALGLLFVVAAAGCSRAVSVGASPAPVFAVIVANQTRLELIVTYDDGSGPRALGAVAAGRSERFVIANPSRTTVDVLGRSQDGSITTAARGVQLVAGQTVPVSLTARDRPD